MPKLLTAAASPYSAKVRMAATHAGIAFTAEAVDTNALPPVLIDNNPLGKIPVWITDDGEAIHDSRVITQHLNRVSG
ncbi:MAG: glutathione S-transferase N-terminal domain-containing protein, partial [Rhizobiaceae bacterium]